MCDESVTPLVQLGRSHLALLAEEYGLLTPKRGWQVAGVGPSSRVNLKLSHPDSTKKRTLSRHILGSASCDRRLWWRQAAGAVPLAQVFDQLHLEPL